VRRRIVTPGRRTYVELRSRFFRAVNRRFHAADFGPEHVPDALRTRWFGLAPRLVQEPATMGEALVRDQWASEFVERDISSFQTQLLAVFLNKPVLNGAKPADLPVQHLPPRLLPQLERNQLTNTQPGLGILAQLHHLLKFE
jgi:hypothetical protein